MHYHTPSKIFIKAWYWFEEPTNALVGDLINVFSYADVVAVGYKKKVAPTIIIDLNQSEEVLWQGMRKRYVREQIEKGVRNGVAIDANAHWSEFVPIYAQFRKGKSLGVDDPGVFTYMKIFIARFEGKAIAGGAFVHDSAHVRAFALASLRFTEDGRMREIVGQANRMIIWQAMLWAKNTARTSFDLGGIDPVSQEREDKSLLEFKQAFGGEQRNGYYYTRVNSRLLKLLLKIRRFLPI